jgi:hypothetical protein
MNVKITSLLILCVLLVSAGSVLGYKYLSENYIAKKQVLGEKEVLTSPSPTISPTPTNTPAPTLKQVTSKLNTPTPTPQKVPVYLPHNNQTVYCSSEGVSAVKDASNTIVQKEDEYNKCGDKLISDTQSCADNCKAASDAGTNKCFEYAIKYSWYPDQLLACKNDVSNQAFYCLDQCKAKIISCPSVSQSYYDSLNSLLNNYCN